MPHCRGVVVRDLAARAVELALDRGASSRFLRRHGVPGDHRRRHPAPDPPRARRRRRAVRLRHGARGRAARRGGVRRRHRRDGPGLGRHHRPSPASTRDGRRRHGLRVVAYDFGVKATMVRQLTTLGTVTVVPAATTADEVLALEPDGVFLSNGPGDPAALPGPDGGRGRPGGPGARSSASASATSSWPRRWAARPTSCPSATTAPTTPCSGSRPVWSRSRARTTTTPSRRAPFPTPR